MVFIAPLPQNLEDFSSEAQPKRKLRPNGPIGAGVVSRFAAALSNSTVNPSATVACLDDELARGGAEQLVAIARAGLDSAQLIAGVLVEQRVSLHRPFAFEPGKRLAELRHFSRKCAVWLENVAAALRRIFI